MSRLRVYYYNKGDMLELVRYQRTERAKAAGCEEEFDEQKYYRKIMTAQNYDTGELGKYTEIMNHHLSLQKRKQIYFSRQILL